MFRRALAVTALLFTPISFGQVPAETDFVLLDGPEGQLISRPESCPIRLELPLPERLAKDKFRYRTEKTRSVHCRSTTIEKLRVSGERGGRDPRTQRMRSKREIRLHVRSDVYLPTGLDQDIVVRYWIMGGDRVLAEGLEAFEGDEGELNWGEGAELTFLADDALGTDSTPTLRIEVQSTRR